MSVNFSKDSPLGKTLFEWWQTLEHDRGSRAELRRSSIETEVVFVPSYHRLCQMIRPFMLKEVNWEERIAAVAGLLSHLKENDASRSFPEQMAAMKGDTPLVSELRFRRLLQRDRAELFTSLIRILRMLSGRANLYDLSESVFYWGDEVRKRWAFLYFPRIPERKSV